jgi:peptidoglycan/xylan/chitin deacetylase (PgdA/CDA1 family)
MRRRIVAAGVVLPLGAILGVVASIMGPAVSAAAPTGRPPDRRIALTFDDLPANLFRQTDALMEEVTGGLLAGLTRNGIPAIGFVNESKLYVDGELRPVRVEQLRRWIDAGLELGNHTFSHPDLHGTDLATYEDDVLRGERVTRGLLEAAGREPRWFRHPFLHTGRTLEIKAGLESFLAEHGYRVAPVTIDNQEWIYARAYDHALTRGDRPLADRIAVAYIAYMDSVVGYYEAQSRALVGREITQVILLHANRLNAAKTDELVGMLRGRGYRFVSIDEALEDPAYRLPDEFTGSGGITWIHRWALTRGERGDFFAGEPEADPFVVEVFNDPPP